MKLSIKNLKGQVFQVEVEAADSVTILKSKIQEAKGMPADSLKIVYKGKTIANEDTIEKLGIKETDFLVVMSQVQKPQPKAEVKPEPPKPEEKKEEKTEEKKEVTSVPKPEAPKPAPVSAPQSNEADINELMSMGFPREQCIEALRAAFNNVERAVEYLINGIPSNLRGQPQQPVQPAGQPGEGQALGVGHLRALFNHPQFAQIRDVIRSNPMALQPILQQISQNSPQLYNLITQHPEEFERIIAGEDDGEGEGEGESGQQGQNPPPGTILISAADEQAINRLRQLGFSKIESAQAYFACDKNEDMAANLLFDRLANGDIEMEPQLPNAQGGNKGPQGGQGGQGGSGQGGAGDNDDDEDNLFN